MHAISSATYYKTFLASKIISSRGFFCDITHAYILTHAQLHWSAQQTLKLPA
jgi:hypothetical protein